MNCEMAREHLDAYLKGALDPERRRQVGNHLAGCQDCRGDFDTGAWIRERTVGLDREIAPPRDLWTGIAPRLHRRSRRLDLPLWSTAAAALLLVAGSSALTVALTRSSATPVHAGFASTEAGYAEVALELSGLYLRARDSLAPETREVLERNLLVIERALGEAREALRADPSNRQLEAVVVAAYRRKIEFLERAAAMDRAG
jgi:hypothetical protein